MVMIRHKPSVLFCQHIRTCYLLLANLLLDYFRFFVVCVFLQKKNPFALCL